MVTLKRSIAVGDYDRMRPLMDGFVQIDGVDPIFLRLTPEEIFFRAMRHAEFNVCELSLSSFSVRTARGDCPYVGVPVFPSRAFRHTSIYVRTDGGIDRPENMRGRRIGVPEYQLTANFGARAILDDDPIAAGCDYFRRTGIFPIMHLLGLRCGLAEQHPWLPGALYKSFEISKNLALERLADESASKATLPFAEVYVQRIGQLMGQDYWPYGVAPNQHGLQTFLRHHHRQGLSARELAVNELFHPATLETFKV
jgi:hypothetical protein